MTHKEMQEKIKSGFYDKDNGENFYEDLVELYNLNDNDPIVYRMYSLAWKNGHAYGYQEVFNHFDDLVNVFKSEEVY